MPEPYLDQSILKSLLEYDAMSGDFTWKLRVDVGKTWNTRYSGKLAGYEWQACPNVRYRCIRIFDWPFLAHRLAWLYVTGEWPAESVDHKDTNGLNNRWSNLRMASKAQNGHNTRKPRTNTSGYKGVSLHRTTGRYRAYIRHDGRQIWLGYHDTAEAAHEAYKRAAIELRGKFARA